jgi:hypothetical protein
MNKSIPTLLRVCAWLSYVVMLTAGLQRAGGLFGFLLLGGRHGLFGGSADPSEWFYMTCAFGLPFASAWFYFRWPWAPILVSWVAIASSNLSTDNYPPRESNYSQLAFVIAAHFGLVSYIGLKLTGLWPPGKQLPGTTERLGASAKTPTLLRVGVRLSFAVMLIAAVVQAGRFLFGLILVVGMISGHAPVTIDIFRWIYAICFFVLPLVSASLYFQWPWGPALLCWLVIGLNLLDRHPMPRDEFYDTQMAFLIAAHLGLVLYVVLKAAGLWPFKTHKEVVAVSTEQIVGE